MTHVRFPVDRCLPPDVVPGSALIQEPSVRSHRGRQRTLSRESELVKTSGIRSGGEWRMADGRWRMADGEWRMANGEWRMANGRWQMADGRWRMANGRWRRAKGRWQMANGEWQ